MTFLAARVGVDTVGGGLLLPTNQQTFCTIQGVPWGRVVGQIADHGTGSHNSATVSVGSPFVTIEGLAALRQGLVASCGHVLTGSGHVTLQA